MQKKRVLAIDYGLKRIGLALSDAMQIIASPLENVETGRDMAKTIEALRLRLAELKAKGQEVGEIVIGLPLHMNGSDSERSMQVREFAKEVESRLALPVQLLDERLSSVQAERSLYETGFSRKKRALFVDRVSAVILLQTYLSQKPSPLQADDAF